MLGEPVHSKPDCLCQRMSAAGSLTPCMTASQPLPQEQASTSGSSAYQVPAEHRGLPKEIILYQYEVCPFCCKVKAFLDYHKARLGSSAIGRALQRFLSVALRRYLHGDILLHNVATFSTRQRALGNLQLYICKWSS